MLVSREDLFEGGKIFFRWRVPRRVIKVLSDYVFILEYLRAGDYEDVHGTRLKFYRDADLDEKDSMIHFLSPNLGIPVARLLLFIYQDGDFFMAAG